MGLPAQHLNHGFTYRDYLTWQDDERWELIGGVAYAMTPAPSRRHQRILREILTPFAVYLTGKTCEVYCAPFDVRLPEGNEDDAEIRTIVQPDIAVVCDKTKLDDRGCRGAPDLIVEIVSPYTARKDMKEKLDLYERVGVREYWIVQPAEKVLTVFRLGADDRYGRPAVFAEDDRITVGLFPELVVDLAAVFRE